MGARSKWNFSCDRYIKLAIYTGKSDQLRDLSIITWEGAMAPYPCDSESELFEELGSVDAVLLGVDLTAQNTTELIKKIKAEDSTLPILVTIEAGDVTGAVSAFRLGADSVLSWPFTWQNLEAKLKEVGVAAK